MTAKEKALPDTGYVVLTLQFERQDEEWFGTCLELDTSTSGSSLDEVQEELHDLVILHLNALEEVGERERFFEEHEIETHWDDSVQPESWKLPLNLAELSSHELNRQPFFQPHLVDLPTEPRRVTAQAV